MTSTIRKALNIAAALSFLVASPLLAQRIHNHSVSIRKDLHKIHRRRAETFESSDASLLVFASPPSNHALLPGSLGLATPFDHTEIFDDHVDNNQSTVKEAVLCFRVTPPVRARRKHFPIYILHPLFTANPFPASSLEAKQTSLVHWCKSIEPIQSVFLLI